jgi:hypothetical protein
MAPAISAMSAQYSRVVLGTVFRIACYDGPSFICSVPAKRICFFNSVLVSRRAKRLIATA